MGNLFLVMAGGAVGSGLRFLFGQAAVAALGPGYPWGTLGVNLVGGLGGFTTFSAFSLDMVTMIERGATPQALGYALLSVVGAGTALFAGLSIARGTAA